MSMHSAAPCWYELQVGVGEGGAGLRLEADGGELIYIRTEGQKKMTSGG